MIGFAQYAKIKNDCCLCYFGYSDEYLVQLRLIKPFLENTLAGLKISFCCKDDKLPLLHGCRAIPISQIKVRKQDFGHLYEIKYNGRTHPIEDLLADTGIQNLQLDVRPRARQTNQCLIVTTGNHPTNPLSPEHVKMLKAVAAQNGYEVVIDQEASCPSLVMGVESVQLFEAAAQGIETRLVATGVGTRLYRCLFPKAEIILAKDRTCTI